MYLTKIPQKAISCYPTIQFAYIINQPKYSIRQLRHLRQCCSDFSISPYWDYLQLPGRANERGLDVLIADVFLYLFYKYLELHGITYMEVFSYMAISIRKTRIWRIDLPCNSLQTKSRIFNLFAD